MDLSEALGVSFSQYYSTTLGLILLEIGVKKIKEAKMGVNVK